MATTHGLLVRFYVAPVHMTFKSEQAGRPIYEDRDHVSIIIPGDKNSSIEREATDDDKQKFAEEYAAFKAGAREKMTGTPLSAWSAMPPSLVKEFEYLNVYTVEHLAGLTDAAKQTFGMGAQQWVDTAKAFLDSSKSTGAVQKAIADKQRAEDELKRARATIKQQEDEINRLKAAKAA